MSDPNYVLRRAAAVYDRDGILPLDVQSALANAGLVIEDVIAEIASRKQQRNPQHNQ